MKLPHQFFLEVVDDRPFLSNWAPLCQFRHLYVPLGLSNPYADSGITQHSFSKNAGLLENNSLELIDGIGVELGDCGKFATAFTDPTDLADEVELAVAPPLDILKRLFLINDLAGVVFNPFSGVSQVPGEAYRLYRHALPRVIGMLESGPISQDPVIHCEYALDYLAVDQVYAALYHASLAREGKGLEDDSYFFSELDCLLTLGLLEEANAYLDWGRKCRRGSLLDLSNAELLTKSGKAQKALALLRPYCRRQKAHSRVWLEKARAELTLGRFKKAQGSFERSLASCPDEVDAWMGMGLTSKALSLKPLDKTGLEKSLVWFSQVSRLNGFRSAEAFFHIGNTYWAMNEYELACEAWSESLRRAPSPATRRNLGVGLYSIGRLEDSQKHYRFLRANAPAHAVSFSESVDHCAGDKIYSLKAGSQMQIEKFVQRARTNLRSWGVTMRCDLMDFKRLDDYINYYAPTGCFLRSSKLYYLGEMDLYEALLDCALHLSCVLVEHGVGSWVRPLSGRLDEFAVKLEPVLEIPEPLSVFTEILHRVSAGASSDKLTCLENLVCLVPDYQTLRQDYVDPFPTLAADPERVMQFETLAECAEEVLLEYGVPHLNGSLDDLEVLDNAIDSLLSEGGDLRVAILEGDLDSDFLHHLGFYFGMLCVRHTNGVWHDHSDLFGVSIKQMPIDNIYPIWRIQQRLESGLEADDFSRLTAYDSPLICAELIQKVARQEIESKQELKSLLSKRLPGLVTDDGMEDSVERLADIITLSANSEIS